MSSGAKFYKKIKATIDKYGSIGTIATFSGANSYDDEGNETTTSTNYLITYVTSNLNAKERERFSQFSEMTKVTIMYDNLIPTLKGDIVTLIDGKNYVIEESDTLGHMQDIIMIKELFCLVV